MATRIVVTGATGNVGTALLPRVGVAGTVAVLKAAHDADVDHLVHMSSVGTYAAGAYGRRVDESWSAAGIASSVYSRTKSAAEALLDDLPRTASPDPSEAIRVRRIARRTRGAAVPDAEQVGDDGV